MPLLTHSSPAPKRIALSCEFTKDQKAAEERLGSAKMYEDVDLRGIPLLEFPASLLEQPTGTSAGAEAGRGRALVVLPEELRGARGGPVSEVTAAGGDDGWGQGGSESISIFLSTLYRKTIPSAGRQWRA